MKIQWVWIALIIAVILAAMQLLSDYSAAGGGKGLPLLMLLLMNEFGFILCAIGGWTAANTLKRTGMQSKLAAGIVLCGVFAVGFLWNMIRLYPEGGIGA